MTESGTRNIISVALLQPSDYSEYLSMVEQIKTKL